MSSANQKFQQVNQRELLRSIRNSSRCILNNAGDRGDTHGTPFQKQNFFPFERGHTILNLVHQGLICYSAYSISLFTVQNALLKSMNMQLFLLRTVQIYQFVQRKREQNQFNLQTDVLTSNSKVKVGIQFSVIYIKYLDWQSV